MNENLIKVLNKLLRESIKVSGFTDEESRKLLFLINRLLDYRAEHDHISHVLLETILDKWISETELIKHKSY
jgi:hypothetical protein